MMTERIIMSIKTTMFRAKRRISFRSVVGSVFSMLVSLVIQPKTVTVSNCDKYSNVAAEYAVSSLHTHRQFCGNMLGPHQ